MDLNMVCRSRWELLLDSLRANPPSTAVLCGGYVFDARCSMFPLGFLCSKIPLDVTILSDDRKLILTTILHI